MTLAFANAESATQPISHIASSDNPSGLTDIVREDINIAVWEREPLSVLTLAAQRLAAESPALRWQCSGNLLALDAGLSELLDTDPQSEHLRHDILLLADMTSCLFDHSTLGVRLSVLQQAMCPRYHVDRVHCRLITTYVGPGMQWLPNTAVDRTSVTAGPLALAPDSELPHQNVYPQSVALCKGDRWPGNTGKGLIHRSPAVAANEQRVLLTIDLV